MNTETLRAKLYDGAEWPDPEVAFTLLKPWVIKESGLTPHRRRPKILITPPHFLDTLTGYDGDGWVAGTYNHDHNFLSLDARSTPATLVHEMVHWLQPEDMEADASEAQAFKVQLAFLRAMGRPESEIADTVTDMHAEIREVRREAKRNTHRQISRNGTDGRVYGGDSSLVHIPDGSRAEVGETVANYLDLQMRILARQNGKAWEGPLCPGCYMIALFNAAIHLAKANGQPLTELGRTMAHAFQKLAEGAGGLTEEIEVMLDPEDDPDLSDSGPYATPDDYWLTDSVESLRRDRAREDRE